MFNLPYIDPKYFGFIIIILAIVLFLVTYSSMDYILRLNTELHKNCPLPEGVCPYKRTIPQESVYGFTIASVLLVFGSLMILSSKQTEKTVSKQKIRVREAVKSLAGEEKQIYDIIVKSDGSAFQNDLIQKTGFSKVKVSRILDRLETKGLVERRRRGMSNMVLLKP